MSPLELILIFGLQFEAISAEHIYIYKRSGHDITLTCGSASSSDTSCSIISWLYGRDESAAVNVVEKGKVKPSSRAARLSLDTSCSLTITNISAEDPGRYACRPQIDPNQDEVTHLSVLTVSPSPPDTDQKRDSEVILRCTLWRSYGLPPCKENRIRWVDETGTVLLDEGVGYEFLGQKNCVSLLKVKRQSGHDRKYTCQFVDEEDKVQIQADYTPVFTGQSDSQTSIIVCAVVGVLVLVVFAAVFIKYRKRAKVTEDVQKPAKHTDEPENNLTYVTVSHANQRANKDKKAKEEEVMYSTVKTSVKTDVDNDPSSLYSNVSRPK